MDFSAPSEADVDMAIHDDALLDINLAAQYSAPGGGLADAFIAGMIPGVAPLGAAHHQQNGHHAHGHHMQQAQPQGYSSVEEYAALMGIKLESNQDDMGHLQAGAMNQFNVQTSAPDPAKIQANAAYFENLYRERGLMNGNGNGGGDMDGNITSMTLPAGVGNGANMFMGGHAPSAAHPHSSGVYDRASELAFNQMNHRMYDPSSGYSGSASTPVAAAMHKPVVHRMQTQHAQQAHVMHDLGAQTLSPEILSAMIKNNNQTMHNYENLSEDERAALIKEEKSRERNRDHSRKSRLRKKEYVENLKQEVQQLQIYQQICEHSQDLIAMITSDLKALFIYTSAAHGRVLGFQPHHLVPGQTSFLDLVHPDHVAEVRGIFQRLENLGDSHRFRFRIKTVDGEVYDAETSARMAEGGIVCSTRVNKDF